MRPQRSRLDPHCRGHGPHALSVRRVFYHSAFSGALEPRLTDPVSMVGRQAERDGDCERVQRGAEEPDGRLSSCVDGSRHTLLLPSGT